MGGTAVGGTAGRVAGDRYGVRSTSTCPRWADANSVRNDPRGHRATGRCRLVSRAAHAAARRRAVASAAAARRVPHREGRRRSWNRTCPDSVVRPAQRLGGARTGPRARRLKEHPRHVRMARLSLVHRSLVVAGFRRSPYPRSSSSCCRRSNSRRPRWWPPTRAPPPKWSSSRSPCRWKTTCAAFPYTRQRPLWTKLWTNNFPCLLGRKSGSRRGAVHNRFGNSGAPDYC